MDQSLDQQFPPAHRPSPSSSGGFYKYPAKIRSLRSPETSIDTPSTILLLDLNKAARSGRSHTREALESLTFRSFDPATSPAVKHIKKSESKRPPLIGGFSKMMQNRTVEQLSRNQMNRADEMIQTEPPNLGKLEFDDLTQYQKWTKETIEPFLKDLRKAILANKPEDLTSYIKSYCWAVESGDPPPECVVCEKIDDSIVDSERSENPQQQQQQQPQPQGLESGKALSVTFPVAHHHSDDN